MLKDKILRKIKKLFVTNDTHISTTGTIDKSARIVNSVISGDITINKNAKIENTILFSKIRISENTHVIDSKIESNVQIHQNTKVSNSEFLSGVNGIEIGSDSIVNGAKIHGDVVMGIHSKIIDGVYLSGKISLGRNVSLNGPGTDIVSNIHAVTIGSFCSIARNVAIQEFNHNFKNVSSYFMHQNVFGETKQKDIISKGPIEIKNDVWIGTQSIILSGVTIGNGVVVAANSTVVSDIPDYAIVGGSPAKIISYRFDKDIIAELQRIKWWDWSDEKIQQHKLFFSESITLENLKKIY